MSDEELLGLLDELKELLEPHCTTPGVAKALEMIDEATGDLEDDIEDDEGDDEEDGGDEDEESGEEEKKTVYR